MARSRSSLRLLCLLCLAPAPLAALAGASGAAQTAPAPHATPAAPQALIINPQQPYHFDAASCDTDYKTHAMVCKSIVLSQGNTVVRADQAEATCMNCQNNRWTFKGDVRIDAQPSGNLRSDQATVEVRDNRIVRATVTGSPAKFEQQRAGNLGMAKGHADQIVYDVGQGTVLLTNDAWLSDGRNEMSGPSISYNIREEKVQATSPGGSQGVHITITPQASSKPAAPPPHGRTAPSGTGGNSAPPPQAHDSGLPGPRPRSRGGRYAPDAYRYELLPAMRS